MKTSFNQREYMKGYYLRNKEKIKAYNKKYHEENPEVNENCKIRTVMKKVPKDKFPALTPKQKHTREKIMKELFKQGEFAMVKRLLVMAMLLLVITSCKTSERTITRDRIVNDTIILHTTESIMLPVKNINIIENPCLNDSLKPLNQTISTPYADVTLTERDGNLVVEVNTDSIINVRVREQLKHYEKDTTVDKQIITKYRLPKWMWWVLGYTVLLTLYTFRKFIPYLNMIP